MTDDKKPATTPDPTDRVKTAKLHFTDGTTKDIPMPADLINYGRLPPTTFRWNNPQDGTGHVFSVDTGAWSNGELVYREVKA